MTKILMFQIVFRQIKGQEDIKIISFCPLSRWIKTKIALNKKIKKLLDKTTFADYIKVAE